MGKFFTAIANWFKRIFTSENVAAVGKVAADVAAEAAAVNAKDVPAVVAGAAVIAADAKDFTTAASSISPSASTESSK